MATKKTLNQHLADINWGTVIGIVTLLVTIFLPLQLYLDSQMRELISFQNEAVLDRLAVMNTSLTTIDKDLDGLDIRMAVVETNLNIVEEPLQVMTIDFPEQPDLGGIIPISVAVFNPNDPRREASCGVYISISSESNNYKPTPTVNVALRGQEVKYYDFTWD